MSSWQLSASAAVAALVAKAKTVSGPDVHDSLVVTASGNKEAIVVAGSADGDSAPGQHYIEHKLPEPGYSSDVDDLFTIYSEVAVLNGSGDLAAARDRAYLIVRDWNRQVTADPTLDGAVELCWLSEVGYRGVQNPRGATAVLLVAHDCRAQTFD